MMTTICESYYDDNHVISFRRPRPGQSITNQIILKAIENYGVIRWHEARDVYVANSRTAQYESGRSTRFHMSMNQIFFKYFKKVYDSNGDRLYGFWVLNPFLYDYLLGTFDEIIWERWW